MIDSIQRNKSGMVGLILIGVYALYVVVGN